MVKDGELVQREYGRIRARIVFFKNNLRASPFKKASSIVFKKLVNNNNNNLFFHSS